jgi:NADH-ubiquinone oxidoreductase chain 1
VFVCALLAIAFYTLFERKFLGHAQVRKGPLKVGFMGLLQPFSDAIKLFLKETVFPLCGNSFGFYWAPILGLFLSLVIWILDPFVYSSYFFLYGGFLFFMVSRLGVYRVIVAGWCSNSKYALFGVMRRIAQTISYEIRMAIFFLRVVVLMGGLNFLCFLYERKVWILFLLPPVFLIWVVIMLAETNRAPFDFAEGESELVSGFNVEYSAGSFAFIFMAEYRNIIIIRVLAGCMFRCYRWWWMVSPLVNSFLFCCIRVLVVWARASLPRMRYDCLMILTWKCFLPFSLGLLVFCFSVVMVLV